MSSALTPNPFDIDAMLAGAHDPLVELLRRRAPVEPALAQAFRAAWRQRSALHENILAVCEPLFAALSGLDPVGWAAAPEHGVWRALALVQHGAIGYQPELGRAGEKILADLGAALAQVGSGGWPAATAALESWWAQEQQRLGRLEQRLVDTERGQLRSRRAQQMAARLLNQAMAGRRFAREVVDYLQREWFQELQWALLQFGADSEQWQRRAQLTVRLVDSLQPADGDGEDRQPLYALIPEVGAELAAVLNERAHDRGLLDQQLALIESQHLLLLRGSTPAAADFQLIANDDPWLSTTTVSANLLQRVAALESGSWFLLRDGDAELRVKLALKLDDSTQLLFVNRLGLKALQKSFEEFAYLLSVGAALPMPAPDNARHALRLILEDLVRRSLDDQHERAEARRQADVEARLRIEAKAKAIAEARALAEALARAEQQAAERAREESEAEAARAHEQQLEQQRQRALLESEAAAQRQQALQLEHELQREQARQLEEPRPRDELQRREAEGNRELQPAVEQPAAASPAVASQPAAAPSAPVDEQRLRAAAREAGLLPIGSWIELHDANGTRRLKVAVKLPSSGKLILVDRDGVRQAEFERDAFAHRLLDGSVEILNQGPKFEDTLAKVVNSMRRDRAPRE